MYKNIMVAIDDSETSRCALNEAMHIARTSSAKLYIVHVADEALLNMHGHVLSHMADVDSAAAVQWLQAAQAPTLIHGHTHRPTVHSLGDGLQRVVLSDWDLAAVPPRADVLRLDASGLQRIALV